jgi:hypothetical protein
MGPGNYQTKICDTINAPCILQIQLSTFFSPQVSDAIVRHTGKLEEPPRDIHNEVRKKRDQITPNLHGMCRYIIKNAIVID